MNRRSAAQAATAKWLRENPWFVAGDDYTADNAVLFIDKAAKLDDGFVEFVDTLVDDTMLDVADTLDILDISKWIDEEEPEDEPEPEEPTDDGWDFI